jgi:competence protein ComEA
MAQQLFRFISFLMITFVFWLLLYGGNTLSGKNQESLKVNFFGLLEDILDQEGMFYLPVVQFAEFKSGSKQLFERQLQEASRNKDHVTGATIAFNLAGIEIDAGNYEKALVYLKIAEEAKNQLGITADMVSATPGLLRVFVNGAVRQTAVYELPPNSLVQQAIDAAGGFADEANTAVINLAQPLSDGLQIYVPTQGEELPAVVSMPAAAPTTSAANPTGSSNASGVININTATKDDLETLPGIGPSTAQNILDHRDANGPFQTIENIMDVSGIGEGRFNQIKELITVSN